MKYIMSILFCKYYSASRKDQNGQKTKDRLLVKFSHDLFLDELSIPAPHSSENQLVK